MAVLYCQDCDRLVDLDRDVEHFPESYWENEDSPCQVTIDNDEGESDENN